MIVWLLNTGEAFDKWSIGIDAALQKVLATRIKHGSFAETLPWCVLTIWHSGSSLSAAHIPSFGFQKQYLNTDLGVVQNDFPFITWEHVEWVGSDAITRLVLYSWFVFAVTSDTRSQTSSRRRLKSITHCDPSGQPWQDLVAFSGFGASDNGLRRKKLSSSSTRALRAIDFYPQMLMNKLFTCELISHLMNSCWTFKGEIPIYSQYRYDILLVYQLIISG